MGVTKAFIKNPETVRRYPEETSYSESISLTSPWPPHIAFRIRNHARSILAQHGAAHPTRMEELPAVSQRIGAAHSTVLEEQQRGHRVYEGSGQRPPTSSRKEGAKEVQFTELQTVHRGLLGCWRGWAERVWGDAEKRCEHWM